MEPILYAGLRNPGRDREIYEAILHRPVTEVAKERNCSPSTIRAAAKRVSDMQLFTLKLTGGAKTLPSGRSLPRASGARRWAPTGTSAAPSRTWSCPLGR